MSQADGTGQLAYKASLVEIFHQVRSFATATMSNFHARLPRNVKDAKTLVKSGDFDFKGNVPASFFDNPFLSENELHKVVFPQLSNNDDITSASNPIPETWYPSSLARWHKPAVPTSKLSYADGLDLYLAVSRINKTFAGVFAQRNVAEPDELEDLVANAVTDARGALVSRSFFLISLYTNFFFSLLGLYSYSLGQHRKLSGLRYGRQGHR